MGNAPSEHDEDSDGEEEGEGEAVFQKYEFGRKLGSGAFGEVCICEDRRTGEEYACKIVDRQHEVTNPGDNTPYFTAQEEADILRDLQHNNISALIETFEGDRFFYVIMELVEGGELFQALSNPSVRVAESDIARIGTQLLGALSYLHTRRVVHRDVKAENVLLSEAPHDGAIEGEIKLIDFGLSAILEGNDRCPLAEEDEKQLDLVCGTPYYLAPEIWTAAQGAPQEWVQEYGSQYGPKVDVWAAGVLLYLSLVGSYPFMGNTIKELASQSCAPECAPSFSPKGHNTAGYGLSPRCTSFLETLLEKDQDSRPSASEALALPWLTQKMRSVGTIPHEVRANALNEMELYERRPVDPNVVAERIAAFNAERHECE